MLLNENDVQWDKVPVTSGTFAGLSVQEARDLNDEAAKKKKSIEKIVEAYRKKKAKDESEPTPERKPAVLPEEGNQNAVMDAEDRQEEEDSTPEPTPEPEKKE
jgi:hypothetical protein